MDKAESLGEFEQIVLLAILRVGEGAYGVTIRSEIKARIGRDCAPGALYTTLDRLEDKGFASSRMGDPTPLRGGRPKRFFEVTTSGILAIERTQWSYRKLLDGLNLPELMHA